MGWYFILGTSCVFSLFIFLNFKSRLIVPFLISTLLLIFVKNFYIEHLGDRIVFIMLIYFWALPKRWKEDGGDEAQLWSLAIYIQIFLIYATETYAKISAGWFDGRGLKLALKEQELVTHFGSLILSSELIVNILNIISITSLFCICSISLYGLRRDVRRPLLLIGIAYHLFTFFLIKLDWLPIANTLPFLLLIPFDKNPLKKINFEKMPSGITLRFLILFVLYSLISSPLSTVVYSHSLFFQLPFQQRWTGYAPPSESTGRYKTTVLFPSETRDFWGPDLLDQSPNFMNLRSYKLFHNMLKKTSKPLRTGYLKAVCSGNPDAQAVELRAEWQSIFPFEEKVYDDFLMRLNCH